MDVGVRKQEMCEEAKESMRLRYLIFVNRCFVYRFDRQERENDVGADKGGKLVVGIVESRKGKG